MKKSQFSTSIDLVLWILHRVRCCQPSATIGSCW